MIANASIPDAEIALGTRHPNAPWLATGGAHTGGDSRGRYSNCWQPLFCPHVKRLPCKSGRTALVGGAPCLQRRYWLHAGGDYFTMQLENIEFLDMYGGLAKLSVADYLAAPSPGIA